jgi:thiol-disulfide isomerase/thioredoxin
LTLSDLARAAGAWVLVVAALAALSSWLGGGRFGVLDREVDGATMAPLAVPDLDGRIVSTATWRGRPTLVNFWATWCPPCIAELPDLVALQDEFRSRLRIVGMAVDEADVSRLRAFVRAAGLNYPVAMTTPDFSERFPTVSVLPTSFLLDAEGRLLARVVGRVDPEVVRSWLRSEDGRAR